MSDKKILGWNVEQTKSLLKFILKHSKQPLTQSFDLWSKQNARQPFSVRNYYYRLVHQLKDKPTLSAELELSEQELEQVFQSRHFGSTQSEDLLREILPLRENQSVRAACESMASGDHSQMIRFQNKYRNLLQNNRPLVERVIKELKIQGVDTREPYSGSAGKILNMPRLPSAKVLREEEIKALFGGLVRLVRRSAQEEIAGSLAREVQFANDTLATALVDMRRKDVVMEELRQYNARLKFDLDTARQNLAQSQSQSLSTMLKLEGLARSPKMEQLRDFLKTLKREQKDKNLKE